MGDTVFSHVHARDRDGGNGFVLQHSHPSKRSLGGAPGKRHGWSQCTSITGLGIPSQVQLHIATVGNSTAIHHKRNLLRFPLHWGRRSHNGYCNCSVKWVHYSAALRTFTVCHSHSVVIIRSALDFSRQNVSTFSASDFIRFLKLL